MIPSDHFTRFYNEVFKFLEGQGEEHLKEYWLEISKNQEFKLQEPLFRRAAIFAGVFIVTKNIKISVIGTILAFVSIKMLL